MQSRKLKPGSRCNCGAWNSGPDANQVRILWDASGIQARIPVRTRSSEARASFTAHPRRLVHPPQVVAEDWGRESENRGILAAGTDIGKDLLPTG